VGEYIGRAGQERNGRGTVWVRAGLKGSERKGDDFLKFGLGGRSTEGKHELMVQGRETTIPVTTH